MTKEKIKPQSLKELAEDWGIDFQVFRIKTELVQTIRNHCEEHKISQRKLASLVPGLTQDRISRIFSGQVGHMTLDKLVQVLSVLHYNVAVKAKAA